MTTASAARGEEGTLQNRPFDPTLRTLPDPSRSEGYPPYADPERPWIGARGHTKGANGHVFALHARAFRFSVRTLRKSSQAGTVLPPTKSTTRAKMEGPLSPLEVRRMIRYAALISLIAAALLTGCGGSAATQSALASTQGLTPLQPRSVSSNVNRRHPWLYVGGYSNNTINAYDLADRHTPLVFVITDGIDGPGGMSIDRHGTLFVANYLGGTVAEYPFGAKVPSVTLSQGLTGPIDVAVDATGNVYVTNRGGSAADIVEYNPGSPTPSRYITSPLIQKPEQVVFDSHGTLYISDDNTGVLMVEPGTSKVTSLGLQGLGTITSGLTLDPQNGNLFVGNNSANQVLVFRPGSKTAAYQLSVAGNPNFLEIGNARDKVLLFSPDFSSNTVSVFRHDARKLFETISTGSQDANGAALKPANVP